VVVTPNRVRTLLKDNLKDKMFLMVRQNKMKVQVEAQEERQTQFRMLFHHRVVNQEEGQT
jgi:hypothetical protein